MLRCRTALGWTFRGSSYCQLIRDVNKTKRLEWIRQFLSEASSGFEDIWTDEATVQLGTYRYGDHIVLTVYTANKFETTNG